MSLSDLASLGSFVSGLAVLASLIFLFFQMQQMTKQVRQSERNQLALMSQGNIDRIANTGRWLAEPHIVDLTNRVVSGETKFTVHELRLLDLRFRQSLLSIQDVYVQRQAGLMDQISYQNAMLNLRGLLQRPAYRALWKIIRPQYAAEWIALVEREIQETPLAMPTDFVALFDSALAEIAHQSEPCSLPEGLA